ncbi:MAG: hypothetical protein OEW83_10480 [Acidimicrobiia bacterium]|nr:hypothetical protein [Acidimicrobiia bacterium]
MSSIVGDAGYVQNTDGTMVAMTTEDLRTWAPLDLAELVALLGGADFRWWIAGGHALELHLGRSWRAHVDVDVGILRSEAPAIHRWLDLAGWDLWLAASSAAAVQVESGSGQGPARCRAGHPRSHGRRVLVSSIGATGRAPVVGVARIVGCRL